MLAKYADALLKKSNKASEEADLEQALVDTVRPFPPLSPLACTHARKQMTVFKYIEDKDVFQKFYSKMLAKRLIHFSSASDDAEANMISKLKDACGFEYTSKLQRMFQDMALCKDLNDQFKEKMAATHEPKELGGESLLSPVWGRGLMQCAVDFHVLVLGTAAWPLTGPTTELKIPTEMLKMFERFEGFYMNKHRFVLPSRSPVRSLTSLHQQRSQAHLALAAQSRRVRRPLLPLASQANEVRRLRSLYTNQKYFFATSA